MIRRLRHSEPVVGLEPALLRAGHAPEVVHLTILEGQHLGPGVGNHAHDELVEVGHSAPEIARITREADFRALAIGDELERPGTDGTGVRRIRLWIADLVDVWGDDGSLGRIELLQQWRVRILEAKYHRAIVGRIDAGQRAAYRRLRTSMELEQDLVEREFHVAGGEARAVVPADAVA